jgi:hypothetical protein
MPKLIFDAGHTYYLPQYMPVYRELVRRGHKCSILFYAHRTPGSVIDSLAREGVTVVTVQDRATGLEHYRLEQPDWILFGNQYPLVDSLPASISTALLYHGIGVKEAYYDPRMAGFDLRFVEGAHRERELTRRFPGIRTATVGFAKLDPLFDPATRQRLREETAAELRLDPGRATILYAPTFYPSSIEAMPADWVDDFSDCNVIIKPHEFSAANGRYRRQRERLVQWGEAEHVVVTGPEEYDLVPFMGVADLLISEASSALFEFAALEKPVVWCDFVKLRWDHRGPLRFRYRKRMDGRIGRYRDVAVHARAPQDLVGTVRTALADPDAHMRLDLVEEIIGLRDGKAAHRIVDVLEEQPPRGSSPATKDPLEA